MPSAAEQLAANLNLGALAKAEEMKRRIWFTLGALLVYRLGTFIPISGIDPVAFTNTFNQSASGFWGLFDLLAGGAVRRMSVFTLSFAPYLAGALVIGFLSGVSPTLTKLIHEGEQGRKQIHQYMRLTAFFFAGLLGYWLASALEGAEGVVLTPGWQFRATTVITMIGGSMYLMWLAEQITWRGVGGGIPIIILAGILSSIPDGIAPMFHLVRTGAVRTEVVVGLLALVVGTLAVIVFMERAQRRLPIQYSARQVGNRVFQGDSSHLPIKLNSSGLVPPIFSYLLLLVLGGFVTVVTDWMPDWFRDHVMAQLGRGQWAYLLVYVVLIVFLVFFYTAVVFNPLETANKLRNSGGFILGRRPGAETAKYIDYVLTRITVVGALYVALVCVVPGLLISYALPLHASVTISVVGILLMFVVSVSMDTLSQLQSHLLAHQYEGLIKNATLRGVSRGREAHGSAAVGPTAARSVVGPEPQMVQPSEGADHIPQSADQVPDAAAASASEVRRRLDIAEVVKGNCSPPVAV